MRIPYENIQYIFDSDTFHYIYLEDKTNLYKFYLFNNRFHKSTNCINICSQLVAYHLQTHSVRSISYVFSFVLLLRMKTVLYENVLIASKYMARMND